MKTTHFEQQGSVINNPEYLLQQLRLQEQGIYDRSGDPKYWEYLTRFNDITGQVVGKCFAVLEQKENSFSWFSTVVSKVVEKIINDEQLNPSSINVLPNDILHENFLTTSYELLDVSSENQSIIFEVVEKEFGSGEDAKIIAEKLKEISNKGIQVAIDDIYITHESIVSEKSQGLENLELLLSYGYKPDIIKLDGEHMNTLYFNRNNPDYKDLIREYKIRLAEFRGIIGPQCIIVAEWVNTHEEIAFAESLGCCGFQGFGLRKLFSK